MEEFLCRAKTSRPLEAECKIRLNHKENPSQAYAARIPSPSSAGQVVHVLGTNTLYYRNLSALYKLSASISDLWLLTASSKVILASNIAVNITLRLGRDLRPNHLIQSVIIFRTQPRWVCSHGAKTCRSVEKTPAARIAAFQSMAPKSHPRSGNRPKESAFAGTRNIPSNKKQAHAEPSPAAVVESNPDALPIELQQAILNVFANAFPLAEKQVELKTSIQEVKGHLYRRDFATAFGKQEYLAAYALRWSAARALAYAGLFATFDPKSVWLGQADQGGEEGRPRIVCIGGGAGAEMLALAAAMKFRQIPRLQMQAVDIADWSHCLQLLAKSITMPPPLFKYASESVKAANRSLLEPGQLAVSFGCEDILEQTQEQLKKLVAGTKLITLMFTLNELFTTSISRTTAFLLALTDAAEVGARLLVVDSPGSYSEVKLGKDAEAKKWPMRWLLDHTLLESAGECKWKKEIGEDSKWFRLDSKLKYSFGLEDMRYQVHVYERT